MLRLQFLRLPVVILILLLCGCASESPWKHQSFALTAPSAETGAVSQTNFLSLRHVSVSPLFEGKALVYRTGENTYDQDPYAEFLVSPDRMLDDCLRLYLRDGHAFAAVLEQDSILHPSLGLAVSVNQLCGDFRQPGKPFAVLQMDFLLYSANPADFGRIIWQKNFSKRIVLAHRTPAALISGWNNSLQQIMEQANADLVHAVVPEGGPDTSRMNGY